MIWLMLLLAALACVYAWLLLPNLPRRDIRKLAARDYAHRGLWNAERPENTLPAFAAAAESGFGIELDVHMTADGHLVVHHDNSLKRLCGEDVIIGQSTLEAVRACRIAETDEQVPLFDEVLETVDGRVPLIVEIKAEENVAPLCRAVYERMLSYRGAWCMESFDPRAVQWFRSNAPQVIRGQLVSRCCDRRTDGRRWLRQLLAASLMQNVLGRPDFVACEEDGSCTFGMPMRVLRCLRPWLVAWTIRSQADMDHIRSHYDLQIFEGFVPRRQ